MKEVLDVAGSVAGIGGIAIAACIIIFKSMIADFLTQHSSKLKREQVFHLLNKILNLIFMIAVIGVLAWAYGKYLDKPDNKSENIPSQTTPSANQTPSSTAKEDLTSYKNFIDVPIQYGDLTGLRYFEQKWQAKLSQDGSPDAAAKAFLIAMQLVEVAWQHKKNTLQIEQRIMALRTSLGDMNANEKQQTQASIASLQSNISVQHRSRKFQLIALFGQDLSVNNPVDTVHETKVLTDYSASYRNDWYAGIRSQYSQMF